MHEDLATDFTTVHKSWCCSSGNLSMEQSSDLCSDRDPMTESRREDPEHLGLCHAAS